MSVWGSVRAHWDKSGLIEISQGSLRSVRAHWDQSGLIEIILGLLFGISLILPAVRAKP